MMKGEYCSLDSDFHGYAVTALDDLCSRWRPLIPHKGDKNNG